MGNKLAATSRCGHLVNFLIFVRDFLDKERNEEPPIIQKYEINKLINDLSNTDDRDSVHIEFEGITFKVRASNMNPKPHLINKTMDVILSMKYDWLKDGRIREEKTEEERKKDSVEIYDCNIEIRATDDNGQRVSFSWHLDCEEVINGKFVHPRFHFHAGGRKISGLDTGQLLMISSPRIAYPPMDLPLAINFIIRNFIHKNDMEDQYNILTHKQYTIPVKNSIVEILKPYFNEVHAKVDTNQSYYFPILL